MSACSQGLHASTERPALTQEELLEEVQQVRGHGLLVEHAVARVVRVGVPHVDGAVDEDDVAGHVPRVLALLHAAILRQHVGAVLCTLKTMLVCDNSATGLLSLRLRR